MSDRERDSIQEMEDIQKGLEAFLQQEMQEMQTSGSGSGKSGTGGCSGTLDDYLLSGMLQSRRV